MQVAFRHVARDPASECDSRPPDKDFAAFEQLVSPWSRKHQHGQSSVFGTLEAGMRYYSDIFLQDVDKKVPLESQLTTVA